MFITGRLVHESQSCKTKTVKNVNSNVRTGRKHKSISWKPVKNVLHFARHDTATPNFYLNGISAAGVVICDLLSNSQRAAWVAALETVVFGSLINSPRVFISYLMDPVSVYQCFNSLL